MIKLGTSKVKFYLGDKKVKSIYQGSTKVWSGASLVSYYDGATLIGTEEVEEGEDVLHPSFSTSKSGYTLYGWRLSNNDTDRIETLTATGEPMTIYAYYLPNSNVIASGYISGNSFVQSVWNPNYLSGQSALSTYVAWNNKTVSGSFSLNKGRYGTASVTVSDYFENKGTGNLGVGEARFDGTLIGSPIEGGSRHSKTFTVNAGSHSLSLYVISYGDYTQSGVMGVTNITLTNPQAWV